MASFVVAYTVVTAIIAYMGIYLGIKSLTKYSHKKGSKYLGYGCFATSVVCISYYLSIISENYLLTSISSSIYFIGVDVSAVMLLIYIVFFTKRKWVKHNRVAVMLVCIYTVIELVIFSINPFVEISVGYVKRDTKIAYYDYNLHNLYYAHLAFVYILVIVITMLILHKAFSVPSGYRKQYYFVVMGIILEVAFNAMYLFASAEDDRIPIDYSAFGYSFIAFWVYWISFKYSSHGMLNSFKSLVFENIDQGLLLFDYADQLILVNEKAKKLMPSIDFREELPLEEFQNQLGIEDVGEERNFSRTFQFEFGEKALRCDYNAFRNSKGQLTGRLYVFTNAALETDLLTGFQNWESFKLFARENSKIFKAPVTAVIFDINGLGIINSRYGNAAGDKRIKELAETMREIFPRGSYFVRGRDAMLVAICYHMQESEVLEYIRDIPVDVQYAAAEIDEKKPDIVETIRTARKALKNKKLLDSHSAHSELINSLVSALREYDLETKEHVERTRVYSIKLAERLGLADIEKSQLSLLCLLHDIGKIGIPQDVINKPGKLDAEEWKIIKTHPRKGYQIAESSTELKEIADMILHHHEKWDGSGYPDGLTKESIPLLSRIISVVDAYDAMTHDRVYRKAMTHEEAVAELKRCAGTQFDPYLVSEFIQILGIDENIDVSAITIEDKKEEEKVVEEENKHIHDVEYTRFYADDELNIISADPYFQAFTGYSRNEKISLSELVPEKVRTEFLCKLNEQQAKNKLIYIEHHLLKKDGNELFVITYGRRFYDEAEKQNKLELVIADIKKTYVNEMIAEKERNKAIARMQRWEVKYRSDSLTGILTHAAFMNDVEDRLMSGGSKVVLIMVDVDKFKTYNDEMGHKKGDEFLILLATKLRESIRSTDLAGRMGGDEFAVAMFFNNDLSDEFIFEKTKTLFDKINQTVSATSSKMSVSMGVAISNSDDNTFNKLYEKADKALYASKENGRNKISLYENAVKAD
ncbi:MAG TPA: PAS domain S-box protein [Lachnospiraceae bacterium]|nr:PAS domain S-box protein [Lachnospiraceae bacterium]